MVGKVKKVMLADERVGKVAKISYTALSKATGLFAISLFKSMSSLAVDYEPNPKVLKASHLKHCASEDPKLAFLMRLRSVRDAPDFVAEEKLSLDRPAMQKRKATSGARKKKPAKRARKIEPAVAETAVAEPAKSAPQPPAPELSEDDDYDDF